MATTTTELFGSRMGDNESRELLYVVEGTENELTAQAAVDTAAPATYNSLVKRTIRLEKQVRKNRWKFSVTYALRSRPETGESTYHFSTTGATTHITQSLATRDSAAAVGNPPDTKQAIGITKDNVEGVDIVIPCYKWSERHYIAAASIDQAYRLTVAGLTGRYNDAAFRGFDEGEVKFLGADGSIRSDEDDWQIEFFFEAIPNRAAFNVGDCGPLDKFGHDYLWCMYEDAEDEDVLLKQPVAAYVEQVAEAGTLTDLGI